MALTLDAGLPEAFEASCAGCAGAVAGVVFLERVGFFWGGGGAFAVVLAGWGAGWGLPITGGGKSAVETLAGLGGGASTIGGASA